MPPANVLVSARLCILFPAGRLHQAGHCELCSFAFWPSCSGRRRRATLPSQGFQVTTVLTAVLTFVTIGHRIGNTTIGSGTRPKTRAHYILNLQSEQNRAPKGHRRNRGFRGASCPVKNQ